MNKRRFSHRRNTKEYLNDLRSDFLHHHVMMSAENPLYEQKTPMSAEEAKQKLLDMREDVEETAGKYGQKESVFIIHNPKNIKEIKQLAHNLGQESVLESSGGKHKLHFLHGENAGKIQSGLGSTISDIEPEDYYTEISTPEGKKYLQHNIDADIVEDLGKAEENENYDLVHFGSKKGLKELDPSFQGTASAGKEKKNIEMSRAMLRDIGVDFQPVNYLHTYIANTGEPESIFERSPAKYHISIPKKDIYDLSKDPEGILPAVKEKYKKDAYFPQEHALTHPDLVHQAIKEKGYKGWTVSGHPQPRFRDTVMLYEKMPAKEIIKNPEDKWEGTSLEKAMTLLKSDVPEGYVVIYSDADNAGNMAKKAVFTNNLDKIQEISKKISLTSTILDDYVKRHGGKTINMGGDDYTGILPKDKISGLAQAKNDIKEKSGFSVTIGIGDTPKKSVYSLTYGKLTGKDKIVEWSPEVQEYVDSLRPKDVEEKQIESLG